MRRGALLVALLLVVAPAAALSAGSVADRAGQSATAAPVVSPDRNTSEYLAPPAGGIEADRVGSATLDVGGTVAADAGAVRGEYGVSAIRTAYERASSLEDRQSLLRAAANRVEARVDAVVARERRARQRFVDGDITTREYLRELAVVSSTARTLDDQVGLLSELDAQTAGSPLGERRLAAMRGRLLGLYGPVRNQIREAMTGEDDGVRVAVAAGPDGLVLSAVSAAGGQYLREAVVHSARDPTAADRYDQQPARTISRVGELYPWTFNASQGLSITSILPDAGVYRIRLPYDHGILEAYLDGGTDQVYYEVQRKDLTRLPTHGTMQRTEGGMVLTVNRTRAGGPLEVTVRDALRREPVDAAVSVDGTVIGRTGGDGTLWTVTPPEQFTVTASQGDTNVSLFLTPSP